MKVLAVGDIHTKTWIIDRVKELLDEKLYDKVVFVGDYADNWRASGYESLYTWVCLSDLQEDFPGQVELVCGNHDYIYTHDTPTLQSGYNELLQQLINYPENASLKEWVRDLPVTVEIDGVTFSHAGVDERWGGDCSVETLWSRVSPIWVRPGLSQYKRIPQVFGHTPQLTCSEIEKNIWCIDTFSQYPSGNPIGDWSMLEIVDGKTFKKVYFK